MKFRTVHDMILIGLLALGLVGGFLYSGPTEAYAILLTNGDMETGAGEPTSWTEWNANGGTGSRDATTFRSVTASAKETVSITAGSGCFYSQYFSALPGEVYIASVYIMSLSGSFPLTGGAEAFIKMEFKDSSGTPGAIINYYESAHLSTHTNGKWQRHTVVGIAPPKTAYVQMNLVTWTDVADASGVAYFDDADLHKVDASTFKTLFTESNSLINESFETGSTTPNGWTGGKTANLDESYALSTAYKRSGANSLMMDAGASASAYALMYESIPVQWGQVVEVTAYVRIPVALNANTKTYLKLEWYKWDDAWANPAGETDRSQVEYSTKKSAANTDWEQLSVIGVAPPISSGGASTDQTFWARAVLIVMNDDGIGTDNRYVYFDDVEVKVSGGFGQKTVATTPSVVASTSPGLQLTFDEGWGGNISSYYDYSVNTGLNHMIADDEDMHALFDINYQEGGSGSWPNPIKNPYGRLSVIEQSPTRTVIQAYAKALDSLKVPGTGTGVDYWTVTYTVYPDGRMFITESVKIGSASDINSGPFWGVTEDYSLGNPATFVDDDGDRAGAMQPAAGGHDAALWVYETGVADWNVTAGFPVSSSSDSGADRIWIQLNGVATAGDPGPFTAGSTITHHWMMDLSDTDFIQADLDSKGSDYKTHTSGSDITFEDGMGSLVTGINSDTYAVDGYDEGAGCWNILTGSGSKLQFTLNAGDQVVTRYKPTFFITGYNDTNLPASVEVDDLSTAADDSLVIKEQGTDYNIAFVPFSKVYKRYNAHQTLPTIYAEGFNNKTATITPTTPDNPVDANKTDDYASWKVNTADIPGPMPSSTAGVLDVWGFDLGSKRDIDAATVNVTYYSAATSGTADTNNIYGFASDFDLDGSFGESSGLLDERILEPTAATAAADQTASQAIDTTYLTDNLLRQLEVRAYTDYVSSNQVTFVAAGAGSAGGISTEQPVHPTPAYPAGLQANDLLFLQVSVRDTTNTPAPNAPAFVAAGTAAGGTGTIAPAYPAGLQNNDLLLLQVTVRNVTETLGVPGDWTLLFGPDGSTTVREWIYYYISDGTETGTFNITTTTTNVKLGRVYAFRNVVGSSFTEGGSFGQGTVDTTMEIPSVTTAGNDRLAVAFLFSSDNNSVTDATGETGGDYTEAEVESTNTSDTGAMINLQTSTIPSTGTISGGVATQSGSDMWGARSFALKPAAATWTALYSADSMGTGRQWIYYKLAGGTESGNASVSIAGTAAKMARIYAFRNCITSSFTEGGGYETNTVPPITDVSTTTTDGNRLAVAFVFRDDDLPVAENFTGETGGDWTEAVADYTTTYGSDGNLQLQTATMASAGTINGGSYTFAPAADQWGNRTFALIPAKQDKTCYLKNVYLSGTYFADDITERMATFDRGSTDYPAIAVFENVSDYLYVGSAYKFSGILVDMYSAGTASGAVVSITPTFEYYNGSSWTSFTPTDGTSGFIKDGMITFSLVTDVPNWTAHNQNGSGRYIGGKLYTDSIGVEEKLYYVRIKRTRTTMDTVPYLRGLATNNLIFQYLRNYLGNPADVTTNTEFSLSAPAATLIDLVDFNAIGYFGKVKLFWKTESELDNVGFNILRSEDGKNYVKINTELIKSVGTPIKGAEYTYEEIDVVNGKIYYYLLEDIDRSGAITKHGPVTAHPGRDLDKDGMTDDWEYRYGLPATVADANVDSDDDGLTNIEEFLAGTDPLVIDSQNVVGTSEANGVRVIESAGLRTVLELDTSTLKVTNKNEGGIIYQLITLPEYTHGQTTDVGKPQIPTKGILLGTLSKKPVTINILESEKETYPGYNIYPVPKTAFTEDPNDPAIKRLTYEFYKDTNAYSIDAFYPGSLAEADYSNYLQDQQVIKVVFYPIQFNPVKGTLEFYKKIKLEVLQEGADLTATASTVTPKTALPLTAENAYKIYINESGIYRLTKAYLESQGISLSDLDPRKLKIYEQGVEIPIYVFGEEDGQFSASDYIEFYGQAVDTRYTGTNVYWLALSDEPGLRMAASGQVEDATTTPGSFLETHRGEDSTLYWMEAVGEDHWFIDSVYGSQIYNLTLNLDGVANTTDEATVKIALEGSVYSGEAFMHHLYARLNGYPIADVSWQGAEEYIINSKTSQSHLNEGANTVTLEVGEDPTGYEEILVNWVEVSYLRNFIAKENVLAFGNYTGGAYKYKISGFTNQDVEIYDITDPRGVQRITQFTVLPEGATFTASFKDIGSKEYVVLTPDKAKIPSGVLRDEPSNLADKKNRADYIIITHPDFYETILPFAEYRSAQGLKVKVVKLDDIYDEFNYGIADVNAVKDFLKYAYNNWTGGRPNYVLLVGDATYDYRDYSGYGFTNYVPTYLVKSLTFGETGSDNWFVCFDGDSDLIPDMLIGRFPVKTTDELKSMIDKVITYEAVSPDEAWTKKMLLVADDGEKIFTETSENLASYLTKGYTADKQYLGTTTNNPAALKQGIINSINDGRLFVNYTGHGGIGLWANERLFTWDDINSLYNRHTLPIFTTLTCADGYFIYPRYIESLGERLINDANGGAIATFVPSGISYPTTQAYLAQGFYGAYFTDKDAILGSMVAKGKLNVYENESGDDAINVIQTFNLFGDPALRVRMKAPQIPAVAAPEVFNLDKGKVNDIFRLTTEEPKAAESAESTETGTVIVDKVKDTKRGLTKIIHAEEAVSALLPATKESLEDKVPAEKVLSTEGTQLEDKTVALAPPKWRVLSKADLGAKPLAKIDYGAVEKNVTRIKEEAGQLAELKTKFDEAIKAADLQKATSILRVIAKLARKIYWRTF